jgi:hypothetical protein
MHITRKDIVPGSKLHSYIIEEVRRRVRHSDREYDNKHEKWREADEIMVAYVPEDMADHRRRMRRDVEGKQSYTTIRVPYAYGVAMSLHAYLTAVFLSRAPVFQFDGVHGEGQMQVNALEALIDYQYRIGRMSPKMFSWLYDVAKYGVGVIGEFWGKDIRHVAHLAPILDEATGLVVDYEEVIEELVTYEGNQIFNVSVYDFLPDPRVTIREFQKGDFCGTRQRLSWQDIKSREMQGYYTNLEFIDHRIVPNFPIDDRKGQDSRAIERPSDDVYNMDMTQAGLEYIKKPEIVPVYEMFVKITPADWGLGPSTYPCMWVFTVTGDWKTVIGATPYGAYHCEYPYHVGEIEMDAQALCNRGVPEILQGVQNTMDWLLNSRMYNVRAINNNLFVVDPLRINLKDVTDPLPGGLIRRKAGVVSGPHDKPIEQLSIQDVTSRNIGDMELMKNVGEQGTGISDLLMGAVPTGGRRTATEARQTAAAGTSRAKVISEYFGGSAVQGLGLHLVSNSQQYYQGQQKLRIVGNLAEFAGQKFIMVDQQSIAGKFDYISADGSLPLDKFAQVNLWKELMQGILADPNMAMQFDVASIFMWVAQLAGLRNVQNFRLVPTPLQQIRQQEQAGNIIPIRPGGTNPDNLTQPTGGVGPVNVGSIYGGQAA